MKKVFCVSLIALMLVCLVCASALAQTTGIAMDGKVYTFTGGEGTYQADGKTFIIGVESVVVQEPGLPDRVLELHQTEGTEIMRDGHPAAAGQETDDSIIIREDTAAYEAAEAIAVYEQYSLKPGPDALRRMRNTACAATRKAGRSCIKGSGCVPSQMPIRCAKGCARSSNTRTSKGASTFRLSATRPG